MFVLGLFQVRVAEAVADPCCKLQSANALLPSSFSKKIPEKKKFGSMTILKMSLAC
jgi:hypothetical protein